MNLEQFKSLSNYNQVGYIIQCLQIAFQLYKLIHDNPTTTLPDELIYEMEKLGNNFVCYGIAAEDGEAATIFEDMKISITRLQLIADIAMGIKK